jgi:hypothetical protein
MRVSTYLDELSVDGGACNNCVTQAMLHEGAWLQRGRRGAKALPTVGSHDDDDECRLVRGKVGMVSDCFYACLHIQDGHCYSSFQSHHLASARTLT